MKSLLFSFGIKAKKAFSKKLNTKIKNKILKDYHLLIYKNKKKIINQNKIDIKNAIKKKLDSNLVKRLHLDEKKILEIIKTIKNIIRLKDPTNVTLEKWQRPNGLKISRVTIPIGIIGIIYESRPNVTSDVVSLCFKSGNPVILKGVLKHLIQTEYLQIYLDYL